MKAKGGKANPYAVCQASTGQSYATGKPLKSKGKGKNKGMMGEHKMHHTY